jgi:hypothetical protein
MNVAVKWLLDIGEVQGVWHGSDGTMSGFDVPRQSNETDHSIRPKPAASAASAVFRIRRPRRWPQQLG